MTHYILSFISDQVSQLLKVILDQSELLRLVGNLLRLLLELFELIRHFLFEFFDLVTAFFITTRGRFFGLQFRVQLSDCRLLVCYLGHFQLQFFRVCLVLTAVDNLLFE